MAKPERTPTPAPTPAKPAAKPATKDYSGKTPLTSRERVRPPTPGFKVRATELLIYEHKRRRPGNVFLLTNGTHFEPRRMERVTASTPTRITTGQQELERKRQEARGGRTNEPDPGGGDPGDEAGGGSSDPAAGSGTTDDGDVIN